MNSYGINPDLNKQQLIDCGFRYNGIDNIYRADVYKYFGRSVIYADIIINLDDKEVTYTVKKVSDDKLYHPYYNGKHLKSHVNNVINNRLKKELDKLVKRGILIYEN